MSTQIGRISGPLLKDNLLRDGVDLAFETDLIYLDVNNNKIGIRNSSPVRELHSLNNILTTNLIVDNLATITSNVTIDSTSKIATFVDDLIISPAGPGSQVIATHFRVGDFDIDGTTITVTASNADLEIRPTGSGITRITNDLNIYGNLHATGDVTVGGNVILGSDENDNVSFFSDVNSNIIPDVDITYVLGSNTKRWGNLYSGFLNGEVVDAATLEVGPIDPSTRQGNIWYVAVNGSYDNVGDHPNGPFDSVEKALSVATYGDTVYIYPGTYDELFPLTVPAGVTITGTDLRNTIIVPDTASEFEDVFLLNDACTVQNLTIKNFYFDSINNKGYAFRFAPNINIVSRSPYIQNISVITKGTVTSGSDPLGFLTGDAGKGAYIDGGAADTNTNEASMLFHSATFITPGVDTITMINGVRVEWLDSFTYYANRGLYALQGTGRLTSDGSTVRYGAEVRSINSANIYGNYGAVADGANTLMYLINHNFAYIGTGKDSSNDPTLVIQTNEAVELNSGQIHYVSFDHVGTFRVGDTFYVDLKNGTTSFDLSSISVGDLAGIKLIDGTDITYIDFSKIETGNLQIAGNTIRSLSGSVDITSASGEIYLDQDVFVPQDLSISNNFTINGTLTFGNQITDTIRFDAEIDDNLDPKEDNKYNIGSPTRNWKNIWSRTAEISDIEINTNYIKTQVSNADLELRTSGTGTVLLEDIRVQEKLISVDNGNIEIQPATTLDITASTTNINGDFYVTGDVYLDSNTILGNTTNNTVYFNSQVNSSIEPSVDNFYNLGDTVKSWNLYTGKTLLDDIEINDNYIQTTASNLNLELRASGNGSVQLEKTYFNEKLIYTVGTNLKIEPATTLDITASTTNVNGDFYVTDDAYLDSNTVLGNSQSDNIVFFANVDTSIIPQISSVYNLGSTTKAWNLYSGKILLDEIEINDNYIQTNVSNLNIEFKANGIGAIRVEQIDFNENIIKTNGSTNLRIEPATTLDIYGNTTQNGSLYVSQNLILDSNTKFGNATSDIVTFKSFVNTSIIPSIDSTMSLGDTVRAWNLYTDKILLDDIEINDNYIQTTISNLNLEFKASGTGAVRLEKVNFNENVIRTTGLDKLELRPGGIVDVYANTNINANLSATGNFTFDGTITVGNADTDNISFISEIDSNLIPDVDNLYNLGSLAKRWKTLLVGNTFIDDIEINTNYIRTTQSNLDLLMRGNGTGGVLTESLRFLDNRVIASINNQNIQISLSGTSILDTNTDTAFRLARGTVVDRPISSMSFGEMRFNTTDSLFSGFTTNRVTFGGVYSADRLTYARVEPTSNVITFVANSTPALTVTTTAFNVNGINVDDLLINNNIITTNVGGLVETVSTRTGDDLILRNGDELATSSLLASSGINLILDPDFNNVVNIDNIDLDDNLITNLSNNAITVAHTGAGYLRFDGELGIVIPAGMDIDRPTPAAQGTMRWSTENNYLEIYINNQWGLATSSGSGFATPEQISEINELYALILG